MCSPLGRQLPTPVFPRTSHFTVDVLLGNQVFCTTFHISSNTACFYFYIYFMLNSDFFLLSAILFTNMLTFKAEIIRLPEAKVAQRYHNGTAKHCVTRTDLLHLPISLTKRGMAYGTSCDDPEPDVYKCISSLSCLLTLFTIESIIIIVIKMMMVMMMATATKTITTTIMILEET